MKGLARVVMIFIALGVFAKVSLADMVAHYPFDGSVVNELMTGNDGVVYGDPVFVDAIIGEGIYFDGVDDYVTIGNAAWLNSNMNSQEGSVSVWIIRDGDGKGFVYQYFGGHGTNCRLYTVVATDDASVFDVVSAIGDRGTKTGQYLDVGDERGKYHVVHTWDASGATQIYVNGQLDVEGYFNNPGFNFVGSEPFYVGRGWTGDPKPFSGTVDDLRLYDHKLSATEVLDLYNLQNNAPVADAGIDQTIIQIGTNVNLDGSNSYDPDGDELSYLWEMVSMPASSMAALSESSIINPSFDADMQGDPYILRLTVSDGLLSSTDEVMVTFQNVAPVAVSGENQVAMEGDTLCFDGSGSYDDNLDSLTYLWSFQEIPVESQVGLDDATVLTPCASFDVPGAYELGLVVNDGLLNSEPDQLIVQVSSYEDEIVRVIDVLIDDINNLDNIDLQNPNLRKNLSKEVNAVLGLIDSGEYIKAKKKIQNKLMPKTNGCNDIGQPDGNDWIENCEAQSEIYPDLVELINLLDVLI